MRSVHYYLANRTVFKLRLKLLLQCDGSKLPWELILPPCHICNPCASWKTRHGVAVESQSRDFANTFSVERVTIHCQN